MTIRITPDALLKATDDGYTALVGAVLSVTRDDLKGKNDKHKAEAEYFIHSPHFDFWCAMAELNPSHVRRLLWDARPVAKARSANPSISQVYPKFGMKEIGVTGKKSKFNGGVSMTK